MSNRATLKDVAARAGVSLTTVSLFLNGNESVCSRETAERIREAISELNYTKGRSGHLASRPAVGFNMPASEGMPGSYGYATATLVPPSTGGLRPLPAETERAAARLRARSRTLGMGISPAFDLLDPNETGPSYLADMVWHGASRMAEWDDYRLLSYPASVRNASDPSPFLDGSVAGLILTGGYEDPRPARLAEAGLPVVLLGRFLDIPDGCGAVYALERDTVDLAMNHLQELGHRIIAHYAGPVKPAAALGPTDGAAAAGALRPAIQYTPSDVAVQRRERFIGWMRMNAAESGGDDPAELVFADDSWRGDRAAEALSCWMSLPEEKRPTAVFCASDALALRLMEAAIVAGISIPDDLSIIGVDDSPAAATATVPLTSVAIPGEQIGREAVRLLLRMIEGIPPASCRLAVPVTRMSVRASTAALAAAESAAPRVTLAAAA